MATITDYVGYIDAVSGKYIATSSPATVASSDVVLMRGLNPSHTHCFLGIHMFDGSGDRVIGGAGTFTVSVLTENTGDEVTDTPVAGTFEDPPTTVIDATAPVTIDWQANTIGIKVVEASVTTAITWKAVFTANRS